METHSHGMASIEFENRGLQAKRVTPKFGGRNAKRSADAHTKVPCSRGLHINDFLERQAASEHVRNHIRHKNRGDLHQDQEVPKASSADSDWMDYWILRPPGKVGGGTHHSVSSYFHTYQGREGVRLARAEENW